MKIKSKLENKKENHNETNININNEKSKETVIFEHLISTLETMNSSINRLDKTLVGLITRQEQTDKMIDILMKKVL